MTSRQKNNVIGNICSLILNVTMIHFIYGISPRTAVVVAFAIVIRYLTIVLNYYNDYQNEEEIMKEFEHLLSMQKEEK